MTSLNERAAKCMESVGWFYDQTSGVCVFYSDERTTADPYNSLDDAALVEAKAIETCGWTKYWAYLWQTVGGPDANETPDCRELVTATAAQRTEAAVRCLESHQQQE